MFKKLSKKIKIILIIMILLNVCFFINSQGKERVLKRINGAIEKLEKE